MTDKAKLHQQQTRGYQAKRILEDELVKEAFFVMRQEIMKAWESTKIDEADVREDCFKTRQAVDRFERCFVKWVRDGEFAAKELLQIQKDSKLKKVLYGRR